MTSPASLILLVATLGGCTQSDMIDLRNASTGQITRCEVVTNASYVPLPQSLINSVSVRSCPADYETLGWQRIN